MDLRFLGAGSAFNPVMENSNAYFSSGGKFFLLDCGETAFGKLWDLPAYLECSEVVAAITHLHSDHVGSLGSLISYSHYVTGKRVTVVHPLDTIVRYLDLVGIDRNCYTYRAVERGETAAFEGGATFSPVEVEHVPGMTCFGYLVSDGEELIYFSGDAKSVPREVIEGVSEGRIARVYQDTSNRESDHPTHASLAYLETAFAEKYRDRIYCTHLDYDYRDLLREKGFRVVAVET